MKDQSGESEDHDNVTIDMEPTASPNESDGLDPALADSTLTPRPSDWEHATILIRKNFRVDLTQKRLWFARTFIGPFLLLLWAFGMFFNYPDQATSTTASSTSAMTTASVGDFIIHPGEKWTYPSTIILSAGSSANDLLPTLHSSLQHWISEVQIVNETSASGKGNYTDSEQQCKSMISGLSDTVCVAVESESSYQVIFDGVPNTGLTAFHPILAGTQRAINAVLIDASGTGERHQADMIQHTPDKVTADQQTQAAPTSALIMPGILISLAFAMTGMFVLGPMVYEKLNFIVDSLLLVGVKRRIYMLQWASYYSLSSGIFTAIALTAVTVFWKLYPMSNAGLIFLSHYLAALQLNLMASFISQVVNQEELATGMPWLVSFASMAVAAPLILFDSARWVLFIFSAISPFVAAITYSAIYTNYDVWGWGTGVQPGLNVASSGLLAVTIAQLFGLLLWIGIICTYCYLLEARPRHSDVKGTSPERSTIEREDAFEDLRNDADVVLSMRDVFHTFSGAGCIKKNKPTQVLKGLDMDLCRGECFGFLGHNGAGKTTSIRIATGELHLQGGQVTYNFSNGPARISEAEISDIRANIGVCPQANVVLGKFSARETLHLFASLKGRVKIRDGQSEEEAITAEVDRRIADLKFEEGVVDKPVETLSGGMKRKVAIATALLGDPQVVFLDEPTAGCDPYSRRQVWELIIRSKQGRCILLTTHFLDEADVLSDRVGIISQGRMMTCGSVLFLKHHFGVGYNLTFNSRSPVDISSIVNDANDVSADDEQEDDEYRWELPHGIEPAIPDVLRALDERNASNVSLDITTLEQVFLATEDEVQAQASSESNNGSEDDDCEGGDIVLSRSGSIDQDADVEGTLSKEEHINRIWIPSTSAKKQQMSFWRRLVLVQKFLMGNAFKMKGAIFLNIIQPVIYLVAMMVVVRVVGVPEESQELRVPEDIDISPTLIGSEEAIFFGLSEVSGLSTSPLVLSDPPESIDALFADDALPTVGGYWTSNQTLQYNATLSPFALQVGAALLVNHSLDDGISTRLTQIPYNEVTFRIDLLLAPMALAFGFMGMAYCVLDALLLKSKNNFELFRVVGITEWTTNLGIVSYKSLTTFLPFFVLVIALGLGLQSVLLGNAGRWLGTILLLVFYGGSIAPLGLIFATVLTDYKSVSQWFPGVFMTTMSLPYTAWVLALQLIPDAFHTILLVGDILCIVPTFAFQRGLGAVIYISPKFQDENLSWGDVWSWQSRVWFTILMMFVVGALEWLILYRRAVRRPRATKLLPEDAHVAVPVDVSVNDEVEAERNKSLAADSGIRARDLVKTFYAAPLKKRGKKRLKKAVAGISVGVESGETFAVVGPNGAGKSVTLSMLSGESRPDHGEIVLDGECASSEDEDINRLYSKSNVSYAPQFDSLFDKKTVEEHLHFYARIRGLDMAAVSTQDHIKSIVELMGLEQHLTKESTSLSGGYKRRLSLAICLLGYPRCIMLDEVTTGMSPDARHSVWDVLRRRTGRNVDCSNMPALLLSTHYMDEASALGTRIAIMINGELCAVGSLESLQDKYCHSYFVEIALENEAPQSAQENILAAFESKGMPAEVYESSYFLRFKMKVPFVSSDVHARMLQLADIFALLEAQKAGLHIKFYSVAHMSLEQIFIDLCRRQFEAEESWRAEVAVEEEQ